MLNNWLKAGWSFCVDLDKFDGRTVNPPLEGYINCQEETTPHNLPLSFPVPAISSEHVAFTGLYRE